VGATEVTDPARALAQASEDAALVVVGSRGNGRVVGALRGSVAFEVAARASSAVVVVTEGSADRTGERVHRVVVGTDGSAAADVAVRFAAARAALESAALHIVTATGAQHADVDQRQRRATAHRIAEAAAKRSRRVHQGLRVTTGVDHRAADQALVDASTDADLVVVGTRGRGRFTGMLLGSVSHAVIHNAASPVAVVGERAARNGTMTETAPALSIVDVTPLFARVVTSTAKTQESGLLRL
jgi:nucleotide-binding universal stress UspA family protein